jgi:hypothetical protein
MRSRSKPLIATGAGLTVLGLAVAGMAPVVGTAPLERVHAQQSSGGAVVLLGWLILGLGIHRFGRESRGESRNVSGEISKGD